MQIGTSQMQMECLSALPLFYLQITQHYSKPRVTPVEVLPVFPDFKVRSYFIWIINLLGFE